MIYTSGTTDRPKGVVTTHAALSAQSLHFFNPSSEAVVHKRLILTLMAVLTHT